MAKASSTMAEGSATMAEQAANAGEGSVTAAQDASFTKVFVRALARRTINDTLHNYFEQFGDIKEAVVIRNLHTLRSRRYGFVTFGDVVSAQRACENARPVIDGARAHCKLALQVRTHGGPTLDDHVLPRQARSPQVGLAHIGSPQVFLPQDGHFNLHGHLNLARIPEHPQPYFPHHYPQSTIPYHSGFDAQEFNEIPFSPSLGTGDIFEYRLITSQPIPRVPTYPLTQAIMFQTAFGPIAGELTIM